MTGPKGRIVAIEPDRENLAILTRNAAMSGGQGIIEIVDAALSDGEGHAQIFLSPDNLGDHRLFDGGEARAQAPVRATTLDGVMTGRLQSPAIVKLDTQGAEAKILRGARRTLSVRPILSIEFWPYGLDQNGDDAMALWNMLSALDYAAFEINDAMQRILPLTDEAIQEQLRWRISVASGRFLNLLCMPPGTDRFGSVAKLVHA